jgi:hypothetical protein
VAAGRACHRIRWRSGDRGLLQIVVHGFSPRCPLDRCGRFGSKSVVVAQSG